MNSKNNKINLIHNKIKSLGFEIIEIIDNSYLHKTHGGYDETGSHFHVIIKKQFEKLTDKIKDHKTITQNFIDLIPSQIHSITIEFKSN